MSKPVGFLPSNIPIDNAGNLMNDSWYFLLQQIYQRVGGAISQTNNELVVGQLDDAGIEEIKEDVYALRDQAASLLAQIQAIADDLNNSPMPQAGYDYNPAAVQISGGTISSVTVDSSPIGNTSASTGKFTDVTTGNAAALIKTSVALTNAAGAAAGTLLNAPTAGNPSKWCQFDDDGTIRKFPTWI